MHNLSGTTWTNVTDDRISDSTEFWIIVLSTYIFKFIVRIKKHKKSRHAKLSLCSAADPQLEWVYHIIKTKQTNKQSLYF